MNEEEIIEIKIYLPDEASTGNYDVFKASDHKYQLKNNDSFNEILTYGTIIKVLPEKKKRDGEEIFVFKEAYAESEYNLEVIGLPMYLNETQMRVIGQVIIDEGGYCEVIFGGMGYVNLLKNTKPRIS